MSYVRKKGGKTRFWMVSSQCIGCRCFQPGHYEHRGATSTGTRSTGQTSPTCLQNAYRGCPDDREYTKEREKERKAEGWVNVAGGQP